MRRIASDVQQMRGPFDDVSVNRERGGALSPAEQRALQRCAPLSTTEFKAVGRLLERGDLPLRRVWHRRHSPR